MTLERANSQHSTFVYITLGSWDSSVQSV